MKEDKHTLRKESHLRSIIKGITWRVIGTLDTMTISWLITGSIKFALTIGSIELASKFILYYLHERVWQLVPIGKVRKIIE